MPRDAQQQAAISSCISTFLASARTGQPVAAPAVPLGLSELDKAKVRARGGALARQLFLQLGGPELAQRQLMGLLHALRVDANPAEAAAALTGGAPHPFLAEFAAEMAQQRGGGGGASAGDAWAAEFGQARLASDRAPVSRAGAPQG